MKIPSPPPTVYKQWHAVMIVVWTIMFPVALLTGLKTSLPFIVGISLYANWATEVGAWQASRAEVRVDEVDVTAKEALVTTDEVHLSTPAGLPPSSTVE